MSGDLNLNNPPKFYLVVLAFISLLLLMLSNSISASEGLPLIGLLVGYSIGNGIAAKQGDPVEPVFGSKKTTTHKKTTIIEEDE